MLGCLRDAGRRAARARQRPRRPRRAARARAARARGRGRRRGGAVDERRLAVRPRPRPPRDRGAARGRTWRRCRRAAATSSTSPSRAPRAARRSPSSPRSSGTGGRSSAARCTARRPQLAPLPSALRKGSLPAAPAGAARSSPSRTASRARPPRARRSRPGSTARSTATPRRTTRWPRARHERPVALPALGLRVGGRVRGARRAPRRRRRRGLDPPAVLARLLRPRPARPPRQRAPGVPGEVPRPGVGGRRRGVRRLARGPHRLSARRRRDAPARAHRLDAQPRAARRRVVSHEGPAPRLAPGRTSLRGAAARR